MSKVEGGGVRLTPPLPSRLRVTIFSRRLLGLNTSCILQRLLFSQPRRFFYETNSSCHFWHSVTFKPAKRWRFRPCICGPQGCDKPQGLATLDLAPINCPGMSERRSWICFFTLKNPGRSSLRFWKVLFSWRLKRAFFNSIIVIHMVCHTK